MASGHMNEDAMVEELDDIDAYIATFDEEERRELAAADAAIDIAILLYRARERRGLSQVAAAKLAGLQQQAVSRFEHPSANPQLETVQAYLGALGYTLELTAIDAESGDVAAKVTLPPLVLGKVRRRTASARRSQPAPRPRKPVERAIAAARRAR